MCRVMVCPGFGQDYRTCVLRTLAIRILMRRLAYSSVVTLTSQRSDASLPRIAREPVCRFRATFLALGRADGGVKKVEFCA
jgi:hypothetical protein